MTETPDPISGSAEPIPGSAEPIDYKSPGPVVAKPSMDYRLRRLAMAAILLGFGLFCVKDGYFVYPRDQADDRAAQRTPRHQGFDIPFNQYAGAILPPLGLLVGGWTLYASRGKYVFDGEILDVPGHPPVPLSAIRQIDRTLWDRKGIAKLRYELPSAVGELTLDDFIYNRKATDDIFDRIERALTPPAEPAA